nr:dnaJ homolog subfamily C member 4 [Loxodonta africana]
MAAGRKASPWVRSGQRRRRVVSSVPPGFQMGSRLSARPRAQASVGGPAASKANGLGGALMSKPMRTRDRAWMGAGNSCGRRARWGGAWLGLLPMPASQTPGVGERVSANRCPPAIMPPLLPLLPLLPLRLCQLWRRSPPTRLLGAAAGQRSGPSNYYELLGVHPGASPEEIKRAFFTKSKELHPDRDPGNPALHSRFVELNEAYHVLSHEQSRRSYDHQLRWSSPLKSPGTTAHPGPAHQARSSWAPPNAQYWAQFHRVRPQGPEARQQQYRHNQRVLGYCFLLMLAGMGLHYVAFRKLEQMHRSFMDEKDRIITAIYNDTRARARANRARLQQERLQRQQPPLPGPPQDPGMVPRGADP